MRDPDLPARLRAAVVWGFLRAMRRYILFSGRAGQVEHNSFAVVCAAFYGLFSLVGWLLSPILGPTAVEKARFCYVGVFLLPSVGVSVRRHHDLGRTGKHELSPFFYPTRRALSLFFDPGQPEANQYGPPPVEPPVLRPR